MTRNDIAKKLVEMLLSELAKRDAQLSFDFVFPSHVSINKAEECVKAVIGIIKHTLMRGETVEISGFGKFVIRQKNERPGRNPQTKEAAIITARKVVSFKPSKLLKNAVNGNQD